MAESLFIRADEVIRLLGFSKSEAYRIIKRLNDEMASKGYIKQDAVLPGGISLHTISFVFVPFYLANIHINFI